MIGATNPLESAPGTIRGQYAVSIKQNKKEGPCSNFKKIDLRWS